MRALALALALLAPGRPVHAQTPTTTAILVDARVLPNGQVAITVDREVAFAKASDADMSLSIPLEGAASIEILEVGEPGRHYDQAAATAVFAYTLEAMGDATQVRWGVAAAAGETRRFIVTYLLTGAVEIDARGDTLARTLLPPDADAVGSAVVRISVPPTVQAIIFADARRVPGDEALELVREGDTAVQLAPTALAPGEGVAVRVTWPTGDVTGTSRAPEAGRDDGAQPTTPRSRNGGFRPLTPPRGRWPALTIAFGLIGAVVALGAVFGAALAVQALRAALPRDREGP